MVASDPDDGPLGGLGRHAEAVALALDDQHREGDRFELGQPALGWFLTAPRRHQGEGEAENSRSTRLRHRSAGHSSAERAPARDQGQIRQLLRTQLLDHRDPCFLEALGRSRTTPSGDAVGLLDECHRESRRQGGISGGGQIRRVDSAPGPVPEDDSPMGPLGLIEMGSGRAGWCIDS